MKLDFGKNEGKEVSELDTSYISYLIQGHLIGDRILNALLLEELKGELVSRLGLTPNEKITYVDKNVNNITYIESVRKVYRNLTKQFHTDTNSNGTEAIKAINMFRDNLMNEIK